ncbi:MAG: hypothetical protein EAX81_06990 [Candidatus Thorarchaeota archaeon]|nr:hypothetical protein [Candidatus Thorarchaeota archaeon]
MNLRAFHPKRETVSREGEVSFNKRTNEELRTQTCQPTLFIRTSALTDEISKRPINVLTRMMMPEFK